ncbi:hypothetical protein WN943_024367 [Citrus x changshan-huyou]
MAERIHPETTQRNEQEPSHLPAPAAAGTYVIQIPKDQIYRVSPPENADRIKGLSRRRKSRSTTCCCFRFCCCSLLLLVLLLAIAAGDFYLVFRPEAPNYSVDDKIGIYYERGSSVEVYYKDVGLCDGVWPQFYQPTNNVTVFLNFPTKIRADANAPIFVYLGAEGPLDGDISIINFLTDNAARFNALLVYIEHRYYEKSIPFGSREEALKNASTLGYFNSAQAITDYAEILLMKQNSPCEVMEDDDGEEEDDNDNDNDEDDSGDDSKDSKGQNGHRGLGARLWWSLSGHGCGSGEAGGGAHVLMLSMWRFTVTSNSTSIDL